MSKIFRRSSCQKASDGTNGAYRWHHRTGFGNGPELSICRPSAILQMPETLTQGVSVVQLEPAAWRAVIGGHQP
jgi:hypothetical protein